MTAPTIPLPNPAHESWVDDGFNSGMYKDGGYTREQMLSHREEYAAARVAELKVGVSRLKETGYVTVTKGFEFDVKWEPVINGHMAGFRCTRSDGKVTYIYMNPSTSGEGSPDLFVYSGPDFDPASDPALHFYTPIFQE